MTPLLVVKAVCAADSVSTTVYVGKWDYGHNRCATDRYGFGTEGAAVIAGIQRYYGACGDGFVDNPGAWGTSSSPSPGPCGSTNYYPKYVLGIEQLNTRSYTIGYCHGICGGYPGYCKDGLTIYRVRDIGCLAGYRFDGNVCRPLSSGAITEKNNGAPPPNSCAGNPINTGMGNKFEQETDYVGFGAFPLIFGRYYNSSSSVTQGNTGFYSWRHSYDRYIRVVSQGGLSTAFALRPDGKTYSFTLLNGAWTSDADVTDKLVRLADTAGDLAGWEYSTSEDEIETYNASGQLLSVSNRAGLAQTFSYDSDGKLTSVTDPFGLRLTFSYDAASRISRMIDPGGGIYNYTYDINSNLASVAYPDNTPANPNDNPKRIYMYENASFSHALTGITDENGNRYATWAYDGHGRAVTSEHAGGAERVELTYNADGTASVTDALGATRTYSFQTQYGVVKPTQITGDQCTTCAGQAQAMTYDANGFLASKTDWNGNVSTYVNDNRGLRISRTDAVGTPQERTITTDWHDDFRLPVRIAEPGKLTDYVYDERGNRLSNTVADTATGASRTTSYTYNEFGQVTAMDGPRTDIADVTGYEYDAQGNLFRVTNALGHVTRITEYDANGRPLSLITPNGVTTTLTYDPRGRLTSRTVAGETTRLEYDGVGNLTKVILPDGSSLTYTYDAAHRLTQIRDQLGNRIVYTLDAMGNRIKERMFDAAGALTQTRSRAFDALSRLVRDIGAANQATSYEYDSNGNRTSMTDPLGRVTGSIYDPLNRLAQFTDPNDGATAYTYDGRDNVTQITDPRGLVTRYGYDGLDNLTQVDSPDTGATTYTYDSAGNPTSEIDARDQAPNYTYDALNRVTSITNPARSFEYDQGANAAGQLTEMTDPAGVTEWTYNAKGRVAQKTQTAAGVALSLRYAYNAKGQLSAITYPSGKVVRYAYDQQGRIGSITVDGAALIKNIQYEPFGPVSGWTWSNGEIHRRSFDRDGRLISQDFGSVTRTLAYDAAGRITRLSHSTAALQDWTLRYDALDRLSSFTGRAASQTFQYDANGNRTSLATGSNTFDYTYPPNNNRLSLIPDGTPETFTYDAAGNLTGDADRAYGYDGRRRLMQVNYSAGSNTYQYNALGQRLSKSGTGTGVIRFVYDEAGHLIGEYNGSGVLLRETVYLGDMPVALLQPNAVRYIYTDHLNAPKIITNLANSFLWRWDSNPFGTTPPAEDFDGNGTKFIYNLRFPGQYYDKETGLHYNYFRDYDPRIGRYIQSDPIGLLGGLNTYAYAHNNPISFSDSLGLDAYMCRRPLAGLGGAGTKSGPDHSYNPLYHQYFCVVIGNTKICGGQDRAADSWLPWEEGNASDDEYDPQRCEKRDDRPCMDECLMRAARNPERPYYGLAGPGTNCQEWADDTYSQCMMQCQGK